MYFGLYITVLLFITVSEQNLSHIVCCGVILYVYVLFSVFALDPVESLPLKLLFPCLALQYMLWLSLEQKYESADDCEGEDSSVTATTTTTTAAAAAAGGGGGGGGGGVTEVGVQSAADVIVRHVVPLPVHHFNAIVEMFIILYCDEKQRCPSEMQSATAATTAAATTTTTATVATATNAHAAATTTAVNASMEVVSTGTLLQEVFRSMYRIASLLQLPDACIPDPQHLYSQGLLWRLITATATATATTATAEHKALCESLKWACLHPLYQLPGVSTFANAVLEGNALPTTTVTPPTSTTAATPATAVANDSVTAGGKTHNTTVLPPPPP